ncbi:dihydrolipoyl dehydrogenase family protein [Paucidesulfovibrio longus]|uniref:dihydrolipoyl dehydrogenase family protein n=1 Tax=Paucidesulfovibrio longus TaxID=889 RepID=UPI00040E538F|nr:NAD(P)/FAD-dependent oxidoreductase [Paucidesulfovibrio longus]
MRQYDAVVIGAGPAGGEAASRLAKAGKSVAIVESRGYGGVCPLRGCNPKKVLLAGAEAVATAQHMRTRGVTGEVRVDWAELQAFKHLFVGPIPEEAENHYMELGADTLHGLARFTGPDSVAVDGPEGVEELRGEHIVLAPGMAPRVLKMPGAEHLLISDDFLDLETLPRRIVFIGGGFIAFEFAHIAARCGAEVTVLCRSTPLKRFDPVLVDELVRATRGAGVDLRLNAPTHGVEKTPHGLRVLFGDGESVEADAVFNVAGRVPDLAPLDLGKAGIDSGKQGVLVNEFMQSVSNPRVYCAGDAAATPFALTPTATIEAVAVAENILHGNHVQPEYDGVPFVCFSIPPIASCGAQERELKARGVEYKTESRDLSKSFPWKRLGEAYARSRVFVDEKGDRILGAHVFGHNAEEIINLFALVIRNDMRLSQVRSTVWAYPTCGYYLKYMV